jgi:hypothetical protein
MGVPIREGIEEVFEISAEEIRLFGALVIGKDGKHSIVGNIRFKDGARHYFKHPSGERTYVREQMLALCKAIAEEYGVGVFNLKFDRVMGYGEFIHLLSAGRGGLN